MPESKFKIGDVVFLNGDIDSQILPMTIIADGAEKNFYKCRWPISNKKFITEDLHSDVLAIFSSDQEQILIQLEDTKTCTLKNCPLGKYKPPS